MKKCPVNLGKSVFCLLENLENFQDTILAVTLQSLIYTLVTACNALLKFFEGIFGLQKIYICMLFSGVHIWTAVYALKICSFYSYRTYALHFQNIPCSQIRNRIRGQIVHQTLKPLLKNYACSSLQCSIPIVFNKSLVPISVNSSSPKYGIPREPPPSLRFKKSL